MTTKIVVIGGGFGGVQCVKTLCKKLRKDKFEIVVFASENHMVFHPLLAEVASSSINPIDTAAPLREVLKGVQIRMEEVCEIDLEKNQVKYQSLEAGVQGLRYDQLVIACGNTSNLAVIPGMADHAFPIKTVGDALALRLHIINQLERAEICADKELRKRLLTFIVVGGGFSGIEVAGEIHDFMKRSAKYYSNFSHLDIKVILAHSRDQILPEVSPSLREYARAKMAANGICFELNAQASFCTADGVGFKDGRFIQAATVICTIGTRPSPIVEKLEVPKEHGRIKTNADMSVAELENVWAIGDCAAIVNAYDGALSPTTGQFAERQGKQVALNILARLKDRHTKPFSHRSLGVLCSIGGRSAVAESMGIKCSGFIAWMAWRGTYLFKLPSIAQKVGVGLTWALGIFFPPALTGLRTDQSRKFGTAHYRQGDWIFKQAEPASEFYVIKEGEVEVVSRSNNEEFTLAVLAKGDFFGEGALMGNTMHSRSVRAKTNVEVLVLGKYVFEQIAEALAPLRVALADAIKRRQISWQGKEELISLLNQLSLSELIEPAQAEQIDQSSTLYESVTKMNEGKLDVLYVVDSEHRLEGLVSRSDLLKAVESAIDSFSDKQKVIPAKAFMLQNPLCAAKSDSTLATLLTMREHGYKRIPVVENHQSRILIGSLRVENAIANVMKKLVKN